jgi:acetyl-CoA carboxylase carboxyltransferase component
MDRAQAEGTELDAETQTAIEHTRAEYDRQLDARYAAARGFVDAIIYPEETRGVLDAAMRSSLENPGPHIGTFGLPAGVEGGGDHG